MDTLEVILILNVVLGLLAFIMSVRLKGELFIRDLVPGSMVILFGLLTFWLFFYETYEKPIHKFLLGMGTLGSYRLWRSQSKITEEVLYGSNQEDE